MMLPVWFEGERSLLRRRARLAGLVVLLSATLTGCGLFDFFSSEEKLEGTRVQVRASQGADNVVTNPAPLPPVRDLRDWTHRNGNPTHASGNLRGPRSPSRIWAVDAGTGSSSDSVITSAPIVAAGRVFVLDAEARAIAFDAVSGARLWETDLAPEGEDGDQGFGGGLAFDSGELIATTGFSEILKLSASTGEIIWRKQFGAPFRAPPSVSNGLAVAVARDNQAYAVNLVDGEVVWRAQGATSDAGFLGGASPAIAGGLALIPFGSGELIGVELGTGRQAWVAVLGGGRRGQARASISDVTGDPVVIGPVVIAANQSGRTVGIDGRNGRRAWTRDFGSLRRIWGAGESVFLVTDDAVLVRLETRSGRTVWRVPLPAYEDPEDREDPIGYSGPVLVNDVVFLTDSLGGLLAFDGQRGGELGITELTAGSRTGPVVAGGIIYVLTDGATLEAYR